jgi:hypothetical protein
MSTLPEYLSPEIWMAQIFSSAEARRGGVVKRQIRDVERLVGRSLFALELRKRGFQAVENGSHFVIFCNNHPVRPVKVPSTAAKPPWPNSTEGSL